MNGMTCIEFRRRMLVDPRDRDPALAAHRRACPGCAAEAERIIRLEAALGEAVRVPVPEGLAARVLLRHSLRPRSRRRRPALRAAAAVAVLAVAVVAGRQAVREPPMPVEHRLAARVEERMGELARIAEGAVADERLVREMFRAIGARLVGDLGPVAYCELTELGGRKAGMLVLRGQRGPVVVFYLPGERVPGRARILHDGLEGVIWPEAGGSIAVLAPAGEAVAEHERRLRRAVHWY